MADPNYPNIPQKFTFDGESLTGVLVGWTGSNPRKRAEHNYPKRAASRQEDMNLGSRSLRVRLEFIGKDCAKQYRDFQDKIEKTPIGLLRHPIKGQFYAFCEGPEEDVDFSRAVNEIKVTVAWFETLQALPLILAPDNLDVASSAQAATAQLSALDQAIATFMGAVMIANTFVADAIADVQDTIDKLDSVDSAIVSMQSSISRISATAAVAKSVIDKTVVIAAKSLDFASALENFVEAATSTDIFDGNDTPAGAATNTATLLGVCVQAATDLFDHLLASSPSPAGAAEAIGVLEESLAACYVVAQALEAEKPPLIDFVVPSLMGVVAIALLRYPGDNAVSRALEIMSLNRIQKPAAIPPGTILKIYAK